MSLKLNISSSLTKVYLCAFKVAFTIKEFREMIHLPETCFQIYVDQQMRESVTEALSGTHFFTTIQLGFEVQFLFTAASRPRKRLTELILQSVSPEDDGTKRKWELMFNRTPIEIFSKDELGACSGLVVGINRLENGSGQEPKVVDTGERETIQAGLILKSIGYKSLPLADELPFDHSRGIILQKDGRVQGMPGSFCFSIFFLIIRCHNSQLSAVF